ncbi:hypothetical protein GCM10028805_55990 [Spirosoma harenae]
MEEEQKNRHWQTIEIPAKDFNSRLILFSENQEQTGALFSRLALIHQVAKSFATESIIESGNTSANLDIEELTNPPLYGYTLDDDPVVIQFSYFPTLP